MVALRLSLQVLLAITIAVSALPYSHGNVSPVPARASESPNVGQFLNWLEEAYHSLKKIRDAQEEAAGTADAEKKAKHLKEAEQAQAQFEIAISELDKL